LSKYNRTEPIQNRYDLIFEKKNRFHVSEAVGTSTVPSTTLSTTTSTTLSTMFSTSLQSMTSTNAEKDLQRGLKRRKRPRKCRKTRPGEIPIYDPLCHGPPIHPPDSKASPPKNPGISNNFKCGSIRQILTFLSLDSVCV